MNEYENLIVAIMDAEVSVKADEHGSFRAMVSVYGNVDLVGDRVMYGAFDRTLADWKASGDQLPVVLSHDHKDPLAYIGTADPKLAIGDGKGLVINGQLDLDNPVAQEVHALMLAGRLTQWSFAYGVNQQRKAADGAMELIDLTLIEIGPCLRGVNPETRTISVKCAGSCECGGVCHDKGEDAFAGT